MFRAVTVRVLTVAACGWLLAGPADALTLGRARGAALIGRPFEVTVPVTLDGPETENPCASADLFYGESPVAGTPSVRWEASSPTQGVVRIQSSTLVDEPMVTVYLRVGCKQQTTTRRYVLLSELPPEDEPAVRAPLQAPSTAPVTVPRSAPAARTDASPSPRKGRSAPAAASSVSSAVSPSGAPAAVAPAPRSESVARARPAQAAPAASKARRQATAPAQARLKLEPLDLTIDRDPTLRASPELALQPADPKERQALSALWQALQAGPEQSVQDALRLQALQRELDSIRNVTRQNATELAQLRVQTEQADKGRSTATVLAAALGAVLLALLAWLAWRWYRVRQIERVGRWFEAHGDTAQGTLPTTPEATPGAAAGIAAPSVAPAMPPSVPARRAPAPALVRGPASTWGGAEEFQGSRGGAVRMVGVEELIDVHDKADFFLSIGETDQALALLDAHVHDQVETGALAWMDLLELYHSLGRRAEYDRLRAEFKQRFTGQVPDFDHFDQPTASLESYSRALSRIVALWPSPRVLDVIEESIFRKPGLPGAEPFSLEAYRELVLLYHVARDMIPAETGARQGPPTTGFPDTSLQPLNVAEPPDLSVVPPPDLSPLTEQERLMIPPASARLGVDIDLDDAEPDPRDLPPLDFDISTFDPADETKK